MLPGGVSWLLLFDKFEFASVWLHSNSPEWEELSPRYGINIKLECETLINLNEINIKGINIKFECETQININEINIKLEFETQINLNEINIKGNSH